MKALKFLIVIILIAAAGAGGWYFGRKSPTPTNGNKGTNGRKILYYQSAMHPHIKSDKPGNCTICGMKLTPVYEGEKGFELDPNLVALTTNQINVINVQTEEVTERPLERTISVAGRIEADETRYRVISAYVPGRVEKLFVNYLGAEVEAGQPLAVLYSPQLLTAEQELATLMARSPSTNSPRMMEEHKRLVQAAQQRLKRLGLTDEQIAAAGRKAGTNLTSQTVAPISGTVVTRAVFEGQYVMEGEKLFEIADLSRMWFRFDVYEQDLPWISLGQKVEVRIPAIPGKTFTGEVKFVDPTLNDATRSAKVRVELDNPLADENGQKRRLLYNNLYAQGSITVKTDPVLAVSRRGVILPGDQPRVYVDAGGGYEHRVVELGRRGNDFWEVLSGVEAGEKVVVEGNLLIDAQAQLNRGAGPSHSHGAPAEAAPKQESTEAQPKAAAAPAHAHVTDDHRQAAEDFLKSVAVASEALAADNLVAYSSSLLDLGKSLEGLNSAFAGTPFQPLVEKVAQAAKLQPGDSLDAARKAYLPFSNASASFAQELRKHIPIQPRVFKCPMYPKMGQTGYWVQQGAKTRNPFYGSEMLDCGSEVK